MTQTGRYLVDSFPDLNRIPFLAGFVTPWKREAEAHFQRQCDLHGGVRSLTPPTCQEFQQGDVAQPRGSRTSRFLRSGLGGGLIQGATLRETACGCW
ncbi:hypothetical protein PG988_013403 [Apiospora saccharicola]